MPSFSSFRTNIPGGTIGPLTMTMPMPMPMPMTMTMTPSQHQVQTRILYQQRIDHQDLQLPSSNSTTTSTTTSTSTFTPGANDDKAYEEEELSLGTDYNGSLIQEQGSRRSLTRSLSDEALGSKIEEALLRQGKTGSVKLRLDKQDQEKVKQVFTATKMFTVTQIQSKDDEKKIEKKVEKKIETKTKEDNKETKEKPKKKKKKFPEYKV